MAPCQIIPALPLLVPKINLKLSQVSHAIACSLNLSWHETLRLAHKLADIIYFIQITHLHQILMEWLLKYYKLNEVTRQLKELQQVNTNPKLTLINYNDPKREDTWGFITHKIWYYLASNACLPIRYNVLIWEHLHSPSLKIGTMRGFICAKYTMAHLTHNKKKRRRKRISVQETTACSSQ